MTATDQALVEDHFLRSVWHQEFEAFVTSGQAAELERRLTAWARRDVLKETASEAAFIQRFFVETWGYVTQGVQSDGGYTCRQQYEVAGAGQGGGKGRADLALGHFGSSADGVPQVLCEFKDIRSGLDARQHRKGNARSPVDQCFDYLHEAYQTRNRDALVSPSWALVTDMREFRLYSRVGGKALCQRFVLAASDDPRAPVLLGDTEAAAFRRFAFCRMFRADMLLAERGTSRLDALVRDQVLHEKTLENTFYREYRAYRDFVYHAIIEANPNFGGTRGKLVRVTQRFLDRCIFILFCEDMGRALRYPPELMRDLLIEYSNSRFYNPEGTAPWDGLRDLFRAMADGGQYGEHTISRFNGGLFEPDTELESLRIPAKVFCAKGQGAGGDATLRAHALTLLYFSAAYNFGVVGSSGERVIGLTTLGRIFEQSITELEIMEAEADGRVSINRLTKRKCDGVYYTPEWVTHYVVENTLGMRFADIKTELGFEELPPLGEKELAEYRAFQKDKRRTARVAGEHRDFLSRYRARLDRLRIVDPACGSGAFLIQALTRLVAEYRWVADEQERLEGHPGLFDQDGIIRSILSHNIYGVDINPESVEITKLALWLHTAAPGKPLCALDENIRCGNSLVGSDFAAFYADKHSTLFAQADEAERERVNAFDWSDAFRDVFAHGGFDCVVGNPPYIKLQHFRRAQADVAEYLATADRPDGTPVYESTRAGNFDMYLPFIEKGIELLKPGGRMGYIAPNLWLVNEYGKPLRAKIKRTQALDRWLDFKSFQVFDEAITYTALQFFRQTRSETVTCAFAPDGEVAGVEWSTCDRIPYSTLPDDEPWTLVPTREKALLDKLRQAGKTLGTSCDGIVVGIQTSADSIYHLTRLAAGRYRTKAGEQAAIEDALMRPLVSGPEAKRYETPATDTWLLFPYDLSVARPTLFTPAEMAQRFPKGWAYLQTHEPELRGREHGKFDDTQWYRFGRNQNLDKQELAKLIVPRLTLHLFCAIDNEGEYFLDNVDAGGVLTADAASLPFLAAVINAPAADYFWRRTSKPFANDYRSANKQFIAPLPIPEATSEQRRRVGECALRLQELHTRRRDMVASLGRRLRSGQTVSVSPALGPEWLWADVGTVKSWKESGEAPDGLKGRELAAWARARRDAAVAARLEELDILLQPGVALVVSNTEDELNLQVDERDVLRVFDKDDTPFIAAQWRQALRGVRVTESFDGKRLLRLLLDLRATRDRGLRDRIVALDADIATLEATITQHETDINAAIYALYRLTPDDIAMIEGE